MDQLFDSVYHGFFMMTKPLRTQRSIDNYHRGVILKEMKERKTELVTQYKEFEKEEIKSGRKLRAIQKRLTGDRKNFGLAITKADVMSHVLRVSLYRKKKEEMNEMVMNFDSLIANAEIAFASMGIMNTIGAAADTTLMKMSEPQVQLDYQTLMQKCTQAMADSSNLLRKAVFDPNNTKLAEEATQKILEEVGISNLDEMLVNIHDRFDKLQESDLSSVPSVSQIPKHPVL